MNNLLLNQSQQMHNLISGTNSLSVMSCSSCLWQQGQSCSLSSMIMGIGHQLKSFNCFNIMFKEVETIRNRYTSFFRIYKHVLS